MEIITAWDGIKYGRRIEVPYIHDYVPGDMGELTLNGALKLLAGPDKIFVDVGAHVGLYTLRAAKLCKEVIAIEPNVASAEGLRINIGLNGLNNVNVLECAISDEDGEKDFYCEDPATASTLDTGLGIPRNIVWTKKVPIRKLDTIIDNKNRNELIIKIDIEGGEEKAIRGCERLIRECSPVFIVEHHEYRGYFACDGMLQRIQKMLEQYSDGNYRTFNLTGAHFMHIHKDMDLGRFVQTIVDYWTGNIEENSRAGRVWYYSLPGNFWHGSSKDDFVRQLLPTYAFDGKLEPQWYEPLDRL